MDVQSVLEAQKMRIVPGATSAEAALQYDKASIAYDQQVAILNYIGPRVTAETVERYIEERKNVDILDVAAGTGLVGEKLKSLGFTEGDAIDPSEKMLLKAKEKNVYKKLIHDFFPCEKEFIADSSYDVLTAAGGLGHGLMKCDCLAEMIRCVKPGGLVVIVAREKYLTMVQEYKDRLEPLMQQLEQEGQWCRLERTIIPNFCHTCNGVLWVFKVTKSSKIN